MRVGKGQVARGNGLCQGNPPQRSARSASAYRCTCNGPQCSPGGSSAAPFHRAIPLDLPLLMGILRAVHNHPELPRGPVLQAHTGALPRETYWLPSSISPLFMWSIPLIVAIVSLSESGDIDWKPLVRSLRRTKTASFELPDVTPSTPKQPSTVQPSAPTPPPP